MQPLNQDVLVLNSDYEPINICNIRRAVGLICLGKVDVLHSDSVTLHSMRESLVSPSVVRLKYHVKRPMPRLRLSRRSVFARDNYTCQYCGESSRDLTVDHVIRAGWGAGPTGRTWSAAAGGATQKKGDKSLADVGFRLATTPRRPRWVPFVSLTKYMDGKRNEVWRDYLPHFGGWSSRDSG